MGILYGITSHTLCERLTLSRVQRGLCAVLNAARLPFIYTTRSLGDPSISAVYDLEYCAAHSYLLWKLNTGHLWRHSVLSLSLPPLSALIRNLSSMNKTTLVLLVCLRTNYVF